MDNITHSLTGALAAKVIETTKVAEPLDRSQRRTMFWLLVISANLPDADVVMRFFGEPLYPLQYHRGITHSLVFSPIFALLPALLFYLLGKWKNFKVLWAIAFAGIVLHIFFDLITAFGTQIFAPLSTARYSLDWMFIIDPLFTGILGLILLLGKIVSRYKHRIAHVGGILVLAYFCAEFVSHTIAFNILERELTQHDVSATKVSILAQPLSIFSWMGLAQTETKVLQTFFNVFNSNPEFSFKRFENANDEFVSHAMQTEEAKWFMRFARHPWIRSISDSASHIVQFRDLQFSINEDLLKSVGFAERSTPFVLQFVFSLDTTITNISFDGRNIHNHQTKDGP